MSLLTLIEMDAMAWIGVVPVGSPVAVKVMGSETSNWPPKAVDAALWNHAMELDRISTVTCEAVPKLKPAAAVNCSVMVFTERVVEKPITFRTNAFAVAPDIDAVNSVGAAVGMLSCNVVAGDGVKSMAPS